MKDPVKLDDALAFFGLLKGYGIRGNELKELNQSGLLRLLVIAAKEARLDLVDPFAVANPLGLDDIPVHRLGGRFKISLPDTYELEDLYKGKEIKPQNLRDVFFNTGCKYVDSDTVSSAESSLFAVKAETISEGAMRFGIFSSKIFPAGRPELLQFANAYPTLSGFFGHKCRVIASGCLMESVNHPHDQAHPELEYNHHGELVEARIADKRDRVLNPNFTGRTYFLGRFRED